MAPHAEIDNGTMNGIGGGTSATNNLKFKVQSPDVIYTADTIQTVHKYHTTDVEKLANGQLAVIPKETVYDFKIDARVPKIGVMLVGLGGNNGSTITASILANRHRLTWQTREGIQKANYFGSLVMASTVKLGRESKSGEDVNVPFHNMLPMTHPNDFVIGGWDISSLPLADAMDRAKVLEPTLKEQIRKEMSSIVPLPSIYYPDFIAANQGERADNILKGDKACLEHVDQIRRDIRYVPNNFNSWEGLTFKQRI